jgi:hypothetical protein
MKQALSGRVFLRRLFRRSSLDFVGEIASYGLAVSGESQQFNLGERIFGADRRVATLFARTNPEVTEFQALQFLRKSDQLKGLVFHWRDALAATVLSVLTAGIFLFIVYVLYANGDASKILRSLEALPTADVEAAVKKLNARSPLGKIYMFLGANKKTVKEEKVAKQKSGTLDCEILQLEKMRKMADDRRLDGKFFKMLHVKDCSFDSGGGTLSEYFIQALARFQKTTIGDVCGWRNDANTSLKRLIGRDGVVQSILGVDSLEFDGTNLPDEATWDRAIAYVVELVRCRDGIIHLYGDAMKDEGKENANSETCEKYRSKRIELGEELAALLAE